MEKIPAGQLLRATGLALVVAAFILIVAVLPAEYGIDPTGAGRRFGLVRPTVAPSTIVPGPDVAVLGQAVTTEPAPFRRDEMTLTLQPGDGGEIKAFMARGRRFVFTWAAVGGAVNFDMHGEPTNAKRDEFTSYWKDVDTSSGHGAFEAPFDGTHGWFWENLGPDPVTITLTTSGFYDKLARP